MDERRMFTFQILKLMFLKCPKC